MNAAGEQDELEEVGLGEARFSDSAVKDDWLSAEGRILYDKLGFVPEQLGGYGECKRMMGRLSEIDEIGKKQA